MTVRCTQCQQISVEYEASFGYEEWHCNACGYTVRQNRYSGFTKKGRQVEPQLQDQDGEVASE